MKFLKQYILSIFIVFLLFSCESTPKVNNIMIPLTGETDTVLMGDFFPVALKAVELMHYASPKNKQIHELTASLYVMYANAFVQQSAELLDDSQFDLQYAEKKRAKMHYLRGRDYSLSYFDSKYKHFSEYLMSQDTNLHQKALSKIKEKDVAAAYWLGAAWLGAFSLDPLDVDILSNIRVPLMILERAAEINPSYNKGAIWDILASFYAGAPSDFGGNKERAVYSFLKEVEYSNGKTTSVYMTYAKTFCKNNIDLSLYTWNCPISITELGWKFPEIKEDEFLDSIGMGQNKASLWPMPTGIYGFEWALNEVLKMNIDDDPTTRLTTKLAKDTAQYLLDHKENYFLIW